MKFEFIKKEREYGETTYEVVGATPIVLGSNANSICGRVAGFNFNIQGKAGGVLSRDEAKRLADRIYEVLGECEETQQEYYNNWSNNFNRLMV